MYSHILILVALVALSVGGGMEEQMPQIHEGPIYHGKDVVGDIPVESVEMEEPLPIEIAQPGLPFPQGAIPTEILEHPIPSVDVHGPVVNLPKGEQEVVDIPHANIQLQGNALHSKEVFINLPSPIIDAPKPVIHNKEVIFKVPQPIFYVPKPVVVLKPMVYRMGHTLRALTPIVTAKHYVFQVPQAEVSGKSAYTQPIPEAYKTKSIH